MNLKQLLKGTIFLMIAGFLSRFIGFFYRIYLSNILGAKNLGIYQLIFPIYSICFTIYASGIQTGISKIASSKLSTKQFNKYSYKNIFAPFFTGTIISLCLSLSLSHILYTNAQYIACTLLKEPMCAYPLQLLSFVFPFCGLTSCINGLYYALKQTAIPSMSQLVEQFFRVGIVYLVTSLHLLNNITCEIAVIGLVLGEIFSCIFIVSALLFNKSFHRLNMPLQLYSFKSFLNYSVPLTLNKLVVNILSSIESILIPFMLYKHGHSHNISLSIYGILTGMSLSFIMFPSTITNSLSVVLLPTISEADASKDTNGILKTVNYTLHYSLLIGIFSLIVFLFWGNELGSLVFNNKMAGTFITILAWLCPFMYITTTFSSILNGLGKTTITFRNSIISVLIRLFFVIWIIPKIGIYGYLLGLLFSTITMCILDFLSLKKQINFNIHLSNTLIKPGIIITFTGFIFHTLYTHIILYCNFPRLLSLFIICFLFLLSNIFILFKIKIIKYHY